MKTKDSSGYENITGDFKTGYENVTGDFNTHIYANGGNGNKTHTEDNVVGFYTIKIDNNMPGVIESLRKSGHNIPPSINKEELSRFLLELYRKDKSHFLYVLKLVPYNYLANNYTTDPNFLNKLAQASNKLKS